MNNLNGELIDISSDDDSSNDGNNGVGKLFEKKYCFFFLSIFFVNSYLYFNLKKKTVYLRYQFYYYFNSHLFIYLFIFSLWNMFSSESRFR